MQVEDKTSQVFSRLDSLLEDTASNIGVSSVRTEVVRVFYCYAREDENLRKELDDHLSALKLDKKIITWCDREIPPGTNWEQEIDVHLNDADLILLLVSATFLASDYCQGKEMALALERYRSHEACVIPVLLRPVDLPAKLQDTPIREFQLLPKDGKPVTTWQTHDLAFEDVAKSISKVVDLLIARIRKQEQHRREFPQKLQEIRDALVQAHQAELDQVHQAHQTELKRLCQEVEGREQVRRKQLEQEHRINLAQVHQAYQAEMKRVCQEIEKKEQACRDQLEQEHRIELEQIHQAHQTNLEQWRKRVEEWVHALKEEHRTELDRQAKTLNYEAEEWIRREQERMAINEAFILFRSAMRCGCIAEMVATYNPILDGSEAVTFDEREMLSLARTFIQAHDSGDDVALLAAQQAIDDSPYRDWVHYTREELDRISLAKSRIWPIEPVKEENGKGCSVSFWFIFNVLPSIELGFLLHVWWASLICFVVEALLFCVAIPIAEWFDEIGKERTWRFVMSLPLGVTWGFVSWFLDSLFPTKIHFLYLPQSLAAIGFWYGLIINFFWIAYLL